MNNEEIGWCCGWYGRCLPKPPVPSINHTLDRYIDYATVVANGQNKDIHPTKKAVDEFRSMASSLQTQLMQIATRKPNWVNEFWLSEMYLRVRLPLPVNSSPAYIFPQQNFQNHQQFIRYSSLLIRGLIDYKDKIDRREVERDRSTGKEKVAMCMEQYERILSTYREPGLKIDEQIFKSKTNDSNEHILAMCRNQSFIVHTRIGGNLLPVADIEYQLKEVYRIASSRQSNLIIPIGGLSSGDRTTAAQAWNHMKKVDTNVQSLQWAKDALFVVCIDEDETEKEDLNIEKALSSRGRRILHGNGSRKNGFNRWYDSTIQLIVSMDGLNGICIEHSTAEGIVIIQMAEYSIRYAKSQFNTKIISRPERQISPKPLSWIFSNDVIVLLEKQREIFDELSRELHLEALIFKDFGKSFIKTCGVSPDGFIQLALQLAHYNLHGYLVSTYESASLRRFGKGRVDNIRANTKEALQWVQSMNDNNITKEQRISLFRTAAEKQAIVTFENITGEGIDNHICALEVLSREAKDKGELSEIPSIFTDELYKDVMRFPLSTSQVTTSSDMSDCYLCYGAVVRDGYGCSYNIQDSFIIFAPSSFLSNSRTHLKSFKLNIQSALLQMKELLTE